MSPAGEGPRMGAAHEFGIDSARAIRTGRCVLRPVSWADLADLFALKGDPRVYGMMLGGVRSRTRVAEELAEDIAFWAARGVGMWAVRAADPDPPRGAGPVSVDGRGAFLGLTGLHERPDGRGTALRFAFGPESRGRGLAREAAGAALRFAHDRAGLPRVIAVAREDNIGSRTVLGAIGMVECDAFPRDGHRMLVYESLRGGRARAAAPPLLPET